MGTVVSGSECHGLVLRLSSTARTTIFVNNMMKVVFYRGNLVAF